MTRVLPRSSPHPLLPQIDPPLLPDKSWHDSKAGPAIGPFDRLGPLGDFRAKAARMWRDPNSTKIEAVGIPAGLDRHVGMRPLMRVARAGPIQQAELVVVEIEDVATQFRSKLGGTRPMLGIGNFVDPP